MSLESVQLIFSLVGSVVTAVGIIFLIYKQFSDPDIKAETEIGLLKQGCSFKHESIDKDIREINKAIGFIKENHLTHIESSLKNHDEKFIKLFTILEERLPKKINK